MPFRVLGLAEIKPVAQRWLQYPLRSLCSDQLAGPFIRFLQPVGSNMIPGPMSVWYNDYSCSATHDAPIQGFPLFRGLTQESPMKRDIRFLDVLFSIAK